MNKIEEYEQKMLEFLKQKKDFDLEMRSKRESIEDLETCIKK